MGGMEGAGCVSGRSVLRTVTCPLEMKTMSKRKGSTARRKLPPPDFGPVYTTPEPNDPVCLAKEPVELGIGGTTCTGDGEVLLRLVPDTRIEIDVRVADGWDLAPELLRLDDDGNYVRFPSRGMSVDAMCSVPGDVIRMTPKTDPVTFQRPKSGGIAEVIFHVFNFPDFRGRDVREVLEAGVHHRVDQLALAAGDWRVELSLLPSTRRHIKVLRETGGYAITQVGRVKRTRGHLFSSVQADDILTALHFFLSFARGAWASPLLAVGRDLSGDVIWEKWGAGRIDSWHPVSSWYEDRHGGQLDEVFPGFMARWAEGTWRTRIQSAIYWYMRCNDSSQGIDAGIVLTQTALELLAYAYAVEDRKLLSRDGFTKLWASDKLRLLFSSLGLPLGVPGASTEIARLAAKYGWQDAPHALTEMRNEIVHPDHKKKGKLSKGWCQAWNLGLWYLEMVLLRLCGYSGVYGNRLVRRWKGDVERVPWA